LLVIFREARAAFGKSEAQRREVSFAEEFARREDLERVEQHVSRLETRLETALEGLRTEMKEDREAIMQAGEHRAVDIHTRLNQMQERWGR
jgi:vacuolar-type H+-ATPase subunit H